MKKIRSKKIYLIREIEELWKKTKIGRILKINKIRAYCLDHFDKEYSWEQVKHALYKFFGNRVNIYDGRCKYLAVPQHGENRKLIGILKLINDEEGKKIWEAYRDWRLNYRKKEFDAEIKYLEAGINKKFMNEKKADEMIAKYTPKLKIKALRESQEESGKLFESSDDSKSK